jgi:hypothetical protein
VSASIGSLYSDMLLDDQEYIDRHEEFIPRLFVLYKGGKQGIANAGYWEIPAPIGVHMIAAVLLRLLTNHSDMRCSCSFLPYH